VLFIHSSFIHLFISGNKAHRTETQKDKQRERQTKHLKHKITNRQAQTESQQYTDIHTEWAGEKSGATTCKDPHFLLIYLQNAGTNCNVFGTLQGRFFLNTSDD